MALFARRENVPWGKASGRVVKHMASNPRRVGELELRIRMPKELPREQRAHYEDIGRNCPVAKSLHPDVKAPIVFEYE